MRSLAGVSLALVLAGSVVPAQRPPAKQAKRFNETTLAGLRPGKDPVARAIRLYKQPLEKNPQGTGLSWDAACSKELLSLDTDKDRRIETIRVSDARWIPGDCNKYPPSPWRTRRGLHVGSPAPLAVQLYGEPDSRSPSTKNGQQLELLYYAFDWAGPDVPQVMEVLCTVEQNGKPGRVVEITLAASSL
jgi:hypothetical protein